MKYLVTVLGNGRAEYLDRALASLHHLNPPVDEIRYVVGDHGMGQCEAQAVCWDEARATKHEWVFHMEEDYVLLRPIDLFDMVRVMELNESSDSDHDRGHSLQQMALMRTPWGFEIEHGGYVPQNPGFYERRYTNDGAPGCPHGYHWIEQTRNWTNAPCLFRSELARQIDFPAQPGCETTLGPLIQERFPGSTFGIWGWGECQAAHIGVERAPGSHGY